MSDYSINGDVYKNVKDISVKDGFVWLLDTDGEIIAMVAVNTIGEIKRV